MPTKPKRDPRYQPDLRRRAARAYRKEGTYRAAAAVLGVSVARTHELVKEHEAEQARRKEARERRTQHREAA